MLISPIRPITVDAGHGAVSKAIRPLRTSNRSRVLRSTNIVLPPPFPVCPVFPKMVTETVKNAGGSRIDPAGIQKSIRNSPIPGLPEWPYAENRLKKTLAAGCSQDAPKGCKAALSPMQCRQAGRRSRDRRKTTCLVPDIVWACMDSPHGKKRTLRETTPFPESLTWKPILAKIMHF
jgi:hypothetical protein